MTRPIKLELKRGTSFAYFYDMPTSLADGYFASGWTMHCQAVDAVTGLSVNAITPTWDNAVTTRTLRVQHDDTSAWPRTVWVDVLFVHADGRRLSVRTVEVSMDPQVSRVLP